MPGFPSAELQAAFVGYSNRHAVLEAWKFYLLMRDQRERHGLRLEDESHVLDFGCGWGRFARMFLRDVPESNIWCADSMELALDTCRESGVPGRMIHMGEMPPSDLPSAQFDTTFAYSVFSHFSPYAHAGWEREFARVMKPGGLAFVTTQGRWFLNRCRILRQDPEKVTTPWEASLARSFVDYEDAIDRYERGEFLYAPNGGASEPSEIYGDAVVPRGYFEVQWSEHFELLDFIADPTICPQAVAVLRRREFGPGGSAVGDRDQ
jgi:SAM-dependent methyltransferase